MNDAEKPCSVCGRRIEWRKKWADCWDEVKYCSEKCRSRKARPADQSMEQEILSLLNQRGNGKTICPSEVARRLYPDADEWRRKMEDVRMAARRLVTSGDIVITQKGRVVDPSHAKGAIRLRLT